MTVSRFMAAAPAYLAAVLVVQPSGPPRRGDGGRGGPRGVMTAASARLGEREDAAERGGGPGGSLWGVAMHRAHVWRLLPARTGPLGKAILEGEREVHGLARLGPVIAPATGQAGDEHQAPSSLRVWRPVHRHRQRARGVVDVYV